MAMTVTVGSSELRSIIPHINETDYIVNSGMPSELPIYRARMLNSFAAWVEQYKDDPLREDAYERAARIHNLLQGVLPVEDDRPIPKDSVLREFIGGSSLEY